MKLRLLIVLLFLPFTILSLWVLNALWFLYVDIFYQNFLEKSRNVEWYHFFMMPFVIGLPLWLTTVYYLFNKWRVKSALPVLELVYLFTSYLSFMLMLIGHMTRFGFWGTMLGIHICCLILLIKAK